MNYSVNLNITPGGMPPILHMSQYDTGRTYAVTIKDADGSNVGLGTNPTAKVKGFNGKNCFEIDATVASSVVTFTLTDAATDQYGIFPVTIELTVDGIDIISPLCMIFDVQKAGYTNEQAASSPEFENAMQAAAQDFILGMDMQARTALLNLLTHVAYIDENGQDYLDALTAALEATLVSIEAVYTQSGTVYNTASLNSLMDDLVVYATYNNGAEVTVTGYELSGTLSTGTSEITVTFGGKTDTFEVTVTADPLPATYQRIEYVERPTTANANTGYNTTGFTPNGTDDLDIKMGVMCIQAPTSIDGGYFLVCRQTTTNNTVGFAVYVTQNGASIGTYDGQSCVLSPPEVVGQKFDLTVLKTSNGCGVTDGTRSNSVTGTPRAMASTLYVFALYPYTGSNLQGQIYGRIYYLNIKEGGVEKVNFIPCKRRSDGAVGFYNTIAEEFKTSSAYVAGPEV